MDQFDSAGHHHDNNIVPSAHDCAEVDEKLKENAEHVKFKEKSKHH